jgi:hypothetical protein
MNTTISRWFVTSWVAVAFAGMVCAPMAEAGPRGGGGGGAHAGGGGGARAGGGGGAKPKVPANNNRADVRTNNVRSTSVNNVNVNKNVNVNVDSHHGGCCNNGWDNDYHPIATAAAVTATVAVTSAIVGSMVRTVPPGCVPVNYGGMIYQQCGSTWYQPQGPQYVVVYPPY